MLRNLKRREDQLVQNLTRVKNRIKGLLDFSGIKFISWAGGSLKLMEEEARKRNDWVLLSMFRELRFLRAERLQVIRDEQACLKLLKREKIQENIQSVSGIGFRTGVALQAELWDMKRFKTNDHLNSYVGLAPHTFGSGEDVTVRCGNRKKKQFHYLMIEAAWRAVRHNMEYKARYGALLGRGMSSQKAIVVIAKKLMQTIRAVWLQDRKYVNLLQESKVKGTSKNCFSAAFRVWTKSNWGDFRWLPSGSHAQIFLYWPFCPCAENPFDRIFRDTLK